MQKRYDSTANIFQLSKNIKNCENLQMHECYHQKIECDNRIRRRGRWYCRVQICPADIDD